MKKYLGLLFIILVLYVFSSTTLYHEASEPCSHGFAAKQSISQVRVSAHRATAQIIAIGNYFCVYYTTKKKSLSPFLGNLDFFF